LVAAWQVFAAESLTADDLNEARRRYAAGEYAAAATDAAEALRANKYGEEWPVLKAQAELALGRFRDAHATVTAALARYPSSVRLRLAAYSAALHVGEAEEARTHLEEINRLATRAAWRYTGTEDLIAIGETALLARVDARDVLDNFFDRARKENPKHRQPYLAAGGLALAKHDSALAVEIFEEALKLFPDDADVHFGLAQALAQSDTERASVALTKALELNPRHVEALLFKAEEQIDAERYDAAGKWIGWALEVNPKHPAAWAYRAVIAHLANDPKGAAAFRAKALSTWRTNPAVDHTIGRKLSQKYRFAEGAAAQRRALEFDPHYLPAQIQLAQDLLRLGDEETGWKLADAAHEADGYDVTTFNLLELRDELARFRTLENDDFILRMEAREAEIYGPQVLELLGRAKRVLCKKYDLTLAVKITVEIFPDENDFAVRTFGLPAVSGYLGVCFGKVITANSPASRGEHPSNWQAVLWHEFCHTVTLTLTNNKMPRWLSEGISVYEELLANPAWGQRMNPQYRAMVLGGELVPISQLSGAFLSPKSPLHLQFAYYESALVVEFLIERYGFDALKHILRDLGAGLPINEALERHTEPLAQLEADFATFARGKAEALAPQADWWRPDESLLLNDSNDDDDLLARWVKEHPNNIAGLTLYSQQLLKENEWEAAKDPLNRLLQLYPDNAGAENPYLLLAQVHRDLKEPAQERAILRKLAAIDADALHVYLRLLELHAQAEDWQSLVENARRVLAVNPLLAQPYRALAEGAEKVGNRDDAIAAYRTLLKLEPDDRAEIHYRLARLLHQQNDPLAKEHILSALEEAPRFRAALQLLLEIHRK
jgi:tetratricopeptide (TPR) repeat protein